MSSIRLVLTTVGNEDDAARIARTLVEERLAACVNIVPSLRSFYWWNEALQDDSELLLVIKCRDADVEVLQRSLAALHPYELPEFVVLDPTDVSSAYAQWIVASTARE